MTYTVEVTREDDAWLATVLELQGAHTFAGNIPALDAAVREVIALVLDVEDDAIPDYRYRFSGVSDAFASAVEVGHERAELERKQREVQERARTLARSLTAEGWSVRDISGALRVSPGRVSQIVSPDQTRAVRAKA